MAAVTLSWETQEDAVEFLALRRDLRRQGWLSDTARDALLELVGQSRTPDE
jgi:hypothetical protein